MAYSGTVNLIKIPPSSTPRTLNGDSQNNLPPCYYSTDTIRFDIPVQNAVVYGVVFSAKIFFLTDLGTATLTTQGILDFSPQLGYLGLFNNISLSRYLTTNVIEQYAIWPLIGAFISRAGHGDDFIDKSVGNGIYPMFNDMSINTGTRPVQPDMQGFWNYTGPTTKAYSATNTSDANAAVNVTMDYDMRSVAFSLPFGMLNANYPIDLQQQGGMSINLQIARTIETCQLIQSTSFALPAPKTCLETNWPGALGTLTNGYAASTTYVPRTPWNSAATFDTFSHPDGGNGQWVKTYAGTLAAPNGLLTNKINNYQIGVLDPILWLFVQPTAYSTVPAPAEFPFMYVSVRRNQTNFGLTQFFTVPFANETVRSLYWMALNKTNTTKPELGYYLTSAFRTYEMVLMINGFRQVYAYPTNAQPLESQWSQYAPTCFLQAALIDSYHPGTFDRVFNGALLPLHYDPEGNGKVFANVNFQYRLTLATLDQQQLPYNNYVPANAGAFTTMSSGPIFQELTALPMLPISMFFGTNPLGNPNTNVWTQWAGIGWAPQLGYSYFLSPTLNLTNAVSTACPYFKFAQYFDPQMNTDMVTVAQESKTVVAATAATGTVPVAPTAPLLPTMIDFMQAPPETPVERMTEFLLPCQVIPAPVANAIQLEFQLPYGGYPGSMWLLFQPQLVNVVNVPTGWAFLQLGAGANKMQYISSFGSGPLYGIAAGINVPNPPTAGLVVLTAGQGDGPVAAGAPVYFQTNPIAWANSMYNTIGPSAILGDTSWVCYLNWLVPNTVQLQFPFLQMDKYLYNYGLASSANTIVSRYIARETNAWMYDPTYEGQLVDCVMNRRFNTMYPRHLTYFPYWDPNSTYSDFPNYALLGGVANRVPIMYIHLDAVHPSFRSMARAPWTSGYNRKLRITLDTGMYAMANVPAGLGRGLWTEPDLYRYFQGVYPSLGSIAQETTPTFQQSQRTIGVQRQNVPGWILNPNQSFGPTIRYQALYLNEVAMTDRLNDFRTRGVEMAFTTFDYQSRYSAFNPILASATGDETTTSYVLYDQLQGNQPLQITGRGTRSLFVLHGGFTQENNRWVPFTNSAVPEPQLLTKCVGYYNVAPPFQNITTYCDLVKHPYYAVMRDGPLAYSLPQAIEPMGSALSNFGKQVATYIPIMDGEQIYPFQIGDMADILNLYAWSFKQPLQRPDFEVTYNAARRYKVYDQGIWRCLDWNCFAFLTAGSALRNNLTYTPFTTSYYFGTFFDNITHGFPLLPTRYVLPIVFNAAFQGGALFQLQKVSSALAPYRNYLTGFPVTNGGTSYLRQTFPSVAGANNQYARNYLPNYYNYTNAWYITRLYAFAQTTVLFFNDETASINYLYPAQGTYMM